MERKPELIEIIEGPTPEFKEDIQRWNWGIYQTYDPGEVALCQLRTGSGEDIRDRCVQAWRDGRRVQLDYPDEMRLRQQIDVVAMRLTEVDQGTVLHLWVHNPLTEVEQLEGDDDDSDWLDLS